MTNTYGNNPSLGLCCRSIRSHGICTDGRALFPPVWNHFSLAPIYEEEDHFSKQCVKLRNWIPLFLGCFFGDRVVCKKKKGNGKKSAQQRRRTLGKKENFSRISYDEKEEGFLYVCIYRFVGYLLTGITIYNPLIYELSSKENLLDSLQFFFPFSPITWTRSIVGTKLYPRFRK